MGSGLHSVCFVSIKIKSFDAAISDRLFKQRYMEAVQRKINWIMLWNKNI